MSSMNKKSGPKNQMSSVAFMWISFALGIIAVLAMFIPLFSAQSQIYNAINGFFNTSSGSVKGAWPAFMGFMFILVGALITGFVALPMFNPSYQLEKLLLIIASVLYALGCFLVMMIVVWWCCLNGCPDRITAYGYNLYPGSYIAGIFALLGAACNIRAIILDK